MQNIETLPVLCPRADDAHKGDFGRVLIIAGSVGMAGAAVLAGKAAVRSGAGLVRVATAGSALATVAAGEPCYTTMGLDEDQEGRISDRGQQKLLDAAQECDIIAIGPGLGVSPMLQALIKTLIGMDGFRMVIDGDGLNNLGRLGDWPGHVRADVVLTPHPGEMNRLWRRLFDEPVPDRNAQAGRLARRARVTVALKGKDTAVSDGGRQYVNTTGNPGMATGGSGDVLTGIIAALMGQKLSSFDATVLGVYVHGLAGDMAAEDLGQISITAADIIDYLPEAFKKVAGESNV